MKNKLVALLIGGSWAVTPMVTANTITPTAGAFVPGVSITYTADLTSGEMASGDGFTIFDLAGVTGTGVTPANWTRIDQATGTALTGPGVLAPLGADTSLTNVTFIYNGPTVEQGLGLLSLGSFLINTTATSLITDDWVSRDHLLGTLGVVGDGGFGPGDRANILVPAQGGTSVPDGGNSLVLLGATLAGLAVLRRRGARS